MFRIGFDPILEAERKHEELIKEMELIRLAKKGMVYDKPRSHNGLRLLALVGRGMASLGSILEERFGDQPESSLGLDKQGISGTCG